MEGGFGPSGSGSVEIAGLSRSFVGEGVLDGVSLDIREGVTALIGANGSGKTTLLRILAGVLDPDRGTVRVAGRPPGRGLAGFAPAGDRMLNWRLTGGENLAFFARLKGVPRGLLDRAIGAAADAADAGDLVSKIVGRCSTGQRRRLMLAVALVGSPPVVLLDEPYADLDERGIAAVDVLASRWANAGGLILYAAPKAEDGPPAGIVVRLVDGRAEVDA